MFADRLRTEIRGCKDLSPQVRGWLGANVKVTVKKGETGLTLRNAPKVMRSVVLDEALQHLEQNAHIAEKGYNWERQVGSAEVTR